MFDRPSQAIRVTITEFDKYSNQDCRRITATISTYLSHADGRNYVADLNKCDDEGFCAGDALDLSWNSFTKHNCDRLVTNEDLRSELEVDYLMEDEQVSAINTRWTISNYTPVSKNTTTSSDKQIMTPLREHGNSNLHPFSIAALIEKSDSSNTSSVCAQVFSPWMNNVSHYPVYTGTRELKKNKPSSIQELSPIRAVSMLKTNDVYWCHVCNSICADKNEADQHQLIHRVHRSRCSLRRNALNEHGYVTRHEQMDNDRLHCSLCNKVVSMCFFSKHQRLHDGHVCNVCGQEFSSNSRLQDHMNVHTGRTPFSCTICDRHFAKRSSLTQHQRYHRDHKNFECKFCHKCFNSKYACAVHERLHTGENPFKCMFPRCPRAFPQKIQLKLHISSHHRS